MPYISRTPKPPYYTVVFISIKGRETWYSHYMIRICKVERAYGRPDS